LRRAGSEHTALLLVARWLHLQWRAARVMAPKQHPQVAEAIEVLQPILHALPHVDLADVATAEATLTRRFVMQALTGADHRDRRQRLSDERF
jgi:hypothetical protein